MKKQLEQRLQELRAEFKSGQTMLTELEAKRANLKETLLRISGAIQVLEEMLADEGRPAANGREPVEQASGEAISLE